MREGTVVKISGPTVVASGLEEASLYEGVGVGEQRLVGEIIRIRGGLATIQVYEETNGLGLGEPVIASGEPLTVELGPGLLAHIFDGVERPLSVLASISGDFIRRGVTHPALDREKRWRFEPQVKVGDAIAEGQLLGTVQETASLVHRVMAPPGLAPLPMGHSIPQVVTSPAAWAPGST